MSSVQVKNVPPQVHQKLRQRAAREGKSLQEYMLALLIEETSHPTVEEIFDRVSYRTGGSISLEFATETLRSERESR